MHDPGGRERLLKLGLRQGPVIVRGEEYVLGQNLDDVIQFLGLGEGSGLVRLPTDQLIGKWRRALQVAVKYARQLPNDRINELALQGRPRTVRQVMHHLLRIAEAFLEASIDGVEYTMDLYQKPPPDGTYTTGEELAVYGEGIDRRLQKWWDELADRTCKRTIKTYYGVQSIYVVYERSTWHSAQHVRQIAAVLERYGIEPVDRLTENDLAGLPMPEEIW